MIRAVLQAFIVYVLVDYAELNHIAHIHRVYSSCHWLFLSKSDAKPDD